MNIDTIGTILTLVFSLFGLAGGVFAFRQKFASETSSAQKQVIAALKEQVATQDTRIEQLRKNAIRDRRVLAAVQKALSEFGFNIKVRWDWVELEGGGKPAMMIMINPVDQSEKEEES